MTPLLTIITPVFNAQATIDRMVRSLERISPEHRQHVEWIAVDDGSSDGSVARIEEVAPSLLPLTIRVQRQSNQGAGAARNRGLADAAGRWIYFLDADDELAADPVPMLMEADATALGVCVRYCRDGRPGRLRCPPCLGPQNYLDHLTASNVFTVSSLFFQKACIENPFDPALRELEDWLFWISNPRLFERMAVRRKVVGAIIHLHGGNKSANQPRMGLYRQQVAAGLLDQRGASLTAKARNNLRLQERIGALQQGRRVPWRTWLIWPCSVTLYLKLCVYALRRRGIAAGA